MNNKVIRFKIDEKSLFYGCKNDFEKGHTATVSTPLNQSNNKDKWRNDILELRETNAKLDNTLIPKRLIDLCQKSSKSPNIIQDIFVFENILIDGKKLETKFQFIMYIKKETAKIIKNQKGQLAKNSHLGRLKLHYPISFTFKSDGFNIDNEAILKAILTLNKNYAFTIRGFEYKDEDKSLNVITSIIGPENALLSTVFKVAKGTGKKLRTNLSVVSLNELMYEHLINENDDIEYDSDIFTSRNNTSRYNGKKGEDFIFSLLSKDNKEIYHTSRSYQTSPYDIEYTNKDGKKVYVEVKTTQSDKLYFRMSKYEYEFMQKYKDEYELYMVTNIKDNFPSFKLLHYEDIMKLKKEVITYEFRNK